MSVLEILLPLLVFAVLLFFVKKIMRSADVDASERYGNTLGDTSTYTIASMMDQQENKRKQTGDK